MTVEEIRKRKRELGYSTAQLCDLCGVPLGTLNKILSGETKSPRYETIQAISRVLENTSKGPYRLEDLTEEQLLLRDELVYGTSARKEKKLYTTADYDALPDHLHMELIDGVFYDMGEPTIVHQSIVGELYSQIRAYIQSKGGSCIPILSPVAVRLYSDDKTSVSPDVLILCHSEKIRDGKIWGAPDFAAEIVSPSSVTKDYVIKAAKYQDAGVKEYWIIDPKRRQLLVYHFAKDSVPQMQELKGKRGLALYDGEPEIDLDEFVRIIERGY